MIKNFFYLFCFFLISNCSIPNTAFFGPVYTGVKTGSVYQASLSYSSGKIINNLGLQNSLYQSDKYKKFSKNPILPDIPFVDEDPKILLTYKVNLVEISSVMEPEPLP